MLSIDVFAISEMGRFYRHAMIQKRSPYHGAVAFAHCGKALFEVLKYFGVTDIAYNQPKHLPYPTKIPLHKENEISKRRAASVVLLVCFILTCRIY